MKLVGRAEIGEIRVAPLAQIWKEHGPQTGISRKEYDEYLSGLDEAVSIKLVKIQRLDEPRPLQELRDRIAGFQPPQSYRYLNRSQVAALA